MTIRFNFKVMRGSVFFHCVQTGEPSKIYANIYKTESNCALRNTVKIDSSFLAVLM